jgi:hypothetical protein
MNHGCVQLQADTKVVSPELTLLFTTESTDSPSFSTALVCLLTPSSTTERQLAVQQRKVGIAINLLAVVLHRLHICSVGRCTQTLDISTARMRCSWSLARVSR